MVWPVKNRRKEQGKSNGTILISLSARAAQSADAHYAEARDDHLHSSGAGFTVCLDRRNDRAGEQKQRRAGEAAG